MAQEVCSESLLLLQNARAKDIVSCFFVNNPHAMEAFKKYGIAHIKDLRVEMMLVRASRTDTEVDVEARGFVGFVR